MTLLYGIFAEARLAYTYMAVIGDWPETALAVEIGAESRAFWSDEIRVRGAIYAYNLISIIRKKRVLSSRLRIKVTGTVNYNTIAKAAGFTERFDNPFVTTIQEMANGGISRCKFIYAGTRKPGGVLFDVDRSPHIEVTSIQA